MALFTIIVPFHQAQFSYQTRCHIDQHRIMRKFWQGAGTTTGTIEGNTFTMENEGMVFAYKKHEIGFWYLTHPSFSALIRTR